MEFSLGTACGRQYVDVGQVTVTGYLKRQCTELSEFTLIGNLR